MQNEIYQNTFTLTDLFLKTPKNVTRQKIFKTKKTGILDKSALKWPSRW
ncbi:hypothetical protein XBJ2_1860046 [Xenorhabdus bovienii str. Jollieti]|uniref:Uncharacterized protein n=1 Tax=Xenorhabdus bovienii (strain SS-2004) TaxID=406818 RepID=D3V531_XENBS|nr:hypothetical protein XBJ1_3642 [Xenorhabdus bovienii SS-2004]CDH28543.1 hypothetical protein XBJ2_1860046 [Xenorhabdus bovienii str. Jollieti]